MTFTCFEQKDVYSKCRYCKHYRFKDYAAYCKKWNVDLDCFEVALEQHLLGEISLGYAVQFTKMHYDKFLELCRKKGVRLRLGPQSVEEFKQDMKSIEKHKAKQETP